jgi:predicted lipoprotein with Yx(FWY)xxD motif
MALGDGSRTVLPAPLHPKPSTRLYLVDEASLIADAALHLSSEGGLMTVRIWKLWPRLAATVVLLAAVVAVVASAQAAPRTAAARLTVRSTVYGKALFGPSGKVLYVFGADRGSTSHCYGVCATAWPPLLTKGAPIAGPGVHANLLGTTKRKNGKLQVTYNHHPLYYYSADKVGKVMCQHANMHGGLWLIIKPNGQPNTAKGTMHM